MSKEFIKVALASESDRYKTVFKSLDLIFEDISKAIYQLKKDDYILIKPNCIDSKKTAASTNADAIRAVLDFIEPVWSGRIVIAEGSGMGSTMEAFKNFRYLRLKTAYPNIEFLDLNYSNSIFVQGYDRNLKPMQLRISNTVEEAPYRISVGPPKTHESVVATLSIKNMAVGSILKEDKAKIHQGPPAINRTIAAINSFTFPHLSVIDGWVGMEGNGPVNGKPIETHFALSSTTCLAADIIACELMGINPVHVGYLNLLTEHEIRLQIGVVGKNPKNFSFHFKHPPNYLAQIQWDKL